MRAWAPSFCLLLAAAAPAAAQGLPELERIHEQRTEVHHDLVNQIARAEGELDQLGRRLSPLIGEEARLRGRGGGLLGNDRAALGSLKRAQNAITVQIARRRLALRGLRDRERVARVELILARSDWVRRLLELASRNTARLLDEPGGLSVNRQAGELLSRARRGMAQLRRLEALEDRGAAYRPEPVGAASASELLALLLDLRELADSAREEAAVLSRVAKARRRLVSQLERSLPVFPDLAQALVLERVRLDRVIRLGSELKSRAGRYDQELEKVQIEIHHRRLEQLRLDLVRVAECATRWGAGRGRG